MGAAIGTCAVAALRGAATQQPNGVKDHALFVGTDFGVVVKGQELPVVDAGDRTFVIQEGSKRRERPLRELTEIRIHRGLKLTNLSATISNLEATLSSDAVNSEVAESTLTEMAMAMRADIARDEGVRWLSDANKERMFVGSELTADPRSLAAVREIQFEATQVHLAAEALHTQQFRFIHQMIETTGSQTTNDGDEVEISPEVDTAGVGLSVSGHQAPKLEIKPTEKPSLITYPVVDAGNGRSDRLDLSFKVSSDHPIDGAYVVVTTEYSIPKSSEVFRRVLSQRIGRIEPQARGVTIYETNYPEGFHLRTYSVGIYAQGQELATNFSQTKLRLTRDEAYDYIATDYIASHRGKSSPPAAVLMAPRSEVAGALARSAEARQPLYVQVDENGKVIDVSVDQKRSRPVNQVLLAALDNFRFIPALDNGKPVSGRAKIVLADFVR